jgi:hypothetical protein
LRKSLVAALAAPTALVMATVAFAQNPAPTIDVTTSVSPTKAGTKKKPKSEKVNLTIINSKESKTSASKIQITFPATLKLSTKGLKTCKVSTLDSQGKAACPKAAKAGSGSAEALVNPSSASPAPLSFNVTTYVAGKNLLAFYLEQKGTDSGVQQALPAKITKAGKGQRLTINIPGNLQQPAPGVYSALQQIKNSLSLKSGKNALVKSVGCKKKAHKIGVKITYVPNPNPPAASTASDTSSAKCSK